MTSEHPHRKRAIAVREIRVAEAARVLGLLDAKPLPTLAEQWARDGIDSPNVRALAGAITSGANPTDQVLAELLAAIAREQRISFRSTQEARAVHAESLVALIGNPAEFSPQLFDLSNHLTDELSARVVRFFRRFRPSD